MLSPRQCTLINYWPQNVTTFVKELTTDNIVIKEAGVYIKPCTKKKFFGRFFVRE